MTTTTTTTAGREFSTPAATASISLARGLGIAGHRAIFETRQYFRRPSQLIFSFLFPVFMLLLFSTIFPGVTTSIPGLGTVSITSAGLLLPSMLASGVLLAGTQALGFDVGIDRASGMLKLLGGTPMPIWAYVLGKFGQVFVTGILQAAVLFGVAAALGAKLELTGEQIGSYVWMLVAGLIVFGLLGIALSGAVRSVSGAMGVIVPPVLVLQFISGIYITAASLPDWLVSIAKLFPVYWLGHGFRSALLPDWMGSSEPGGEWNIAGFATSLGIWAAIGAVLVAVTFRFYRRR